MIEIRIHGRGGQGAVTAAEILATAAFKDGKYSQAFPRFGPERRGAPVEAFCRIDDKFITVRTFVYEPDFLVVLDEGLIHATDITSGLKKDGTIVINTNKKASEFNLPFTVHTFDATKIAMDAFGKPIVNTIILGAFAKATKIVSIKSLEEAVAEKFSGAMADKNVALVKKSYEEMK